MYQELANRNPAARGKTTAETGSKMTQRLSLADKGLKAAVITMLSEVKKNMVGVNEKTHDRNKEGNESDHQVEMIKPKKTVWKKNSLGGLRNRKEVVEETV